MYQQLGESSGNVLGFRIGDRITEREMREIGRILEKNIAASGKIRLILIIDPFRGKSSDLLLEDLKFTHTYAHGIERMAVVGDKAWEKTWIALVCLFAGIVDWEYFDRSEIGAAWRWIRK